MTAFEEAEFWDYITVDEHGNMNGVRDDIPESAMIEYKAFLEEKRQADKYNIKI